MQQFLFKAELPTDITVQLDNLKLVIALLQLVDKLMYYQSTFSYVDFVYFKKFYYCTIIPYNNTIYIIVFSLSDNVYYSMIYKK